MPVLTGLTRETCRVLLLKKIIKQMINKLIKRKTPCVILQQESQKTEFRGKASLCVWELFPVKRDFPFLLSFEWHLKNTAAESHAHKVWSQVGNPPSQAVTAFSGRSEFSSLSCLHSAQRPSQVLNSTAREPQQAASDPQPDPGPRDHPHISSQRRTSAPGWHRSLPQSKRNSVRTNLCQTADYTLNLKFRARQAGSGSAEQGDRLPYLVFPVVCLASEFEKSPNFICHPLAPEANAPESSLPHPGHAVTLPHSYTSLAPHLLHPPVPPQYSAPRIHRY